MGMKNMNIPVLGKIELRSLGIGIGLLVIGMGSFAGTNGKFFGIEVNQPQKYLLGNSWMQVIGGFCILSGVFMMIKSNEATKDLLNRIKKLPGVGDVVEITETQTTI
jgi:hypothetical protein|tara:strand:+ start:60 stop:380 length:321 start_codon:yes stop_codon:yes gene_type:complete